MLVHDVDGLHRLEALLEAGLRHEALERVLDVVGHQLAAVHGRLVVEVDALAQAERVDLAVLGDRPLLGQVGQDREVGRMLLLGPVGEAHELAIREADVGVREEADREMRVEPGRLALGDAQHAAALGRLCVGGGTGQGEQERQQQRDDDGATGHQGLLGRAKRWTIMTGASTR